MDPLYFDWSDTSTIDYLVHSMDKQAIFVGETDTVPGLYAPVSPEGIKALNAIKNRSKKPYIVLTRSQETALKMVQEDTITEPLRKLMHTCWPGPLTIIFPAHTTFNASMPDNSGTVALRVPHHVGIQRLLLRVDNVLSTSANIAHEPTPTTVAACDPRILEQVACVVTDIHRVAQPISCASTIVTATQAGTLQIIREGTYTRHYLESLLGGPL